MHAHKEFGLKTNVSNYPILHMHLYLHFLHKFYVYVYVLSFHCFPSILCGYMFLFSYSISAIIKESL